MKALVLSGGSIKGAFQAGAIRWILDHGFEPDVVYGISVGSLNGAFLAERAGSRVRQGKDVNWSEIGRELEDFWMNEVTSPRDLIRKRGTVSLVLSLVRNRFDGMTDTAPLRRMIFRELAPENLAASPIRFEAGAVNMHTGDIVYARHDWPNILHYIYASTAIPIAMPLVDVPVNDQSAPFYDGGIRDIAPLGRALNVARQEGTDLTEIVAIVCQSEHVTPSEFDRGNILSITSRIMDIVTTEIVENDLSFIRWINRLLEREDASEVRVGGKTYRRVLPVLIRPEAEFDVQIDNFSRDDIRAMLRQGSDEAAEAYLPSSPGAVNS